MAAFPDIKSKHSLVAKHVTPERWQKLSGHITKTSKFTLAKAIACAVELDNQHCGIYAGDEDSYVDFADVFDPIIREYHIFPPGTKHVSDMDATKVAGLKIDDDVPVISVRIRVARCIQGYGLSPSITKEKRVALEKLVEKALGKITGDIAGKYHPLTGMDENIRQQLVKDHLLFMSGDPNLKIAGMERDWPEGRGIFLNQDKTFIVWVNEEDHLRIISMQEGKDVAFVFERLARGIKTVQDAIKAECNADFQFSDQYGFIQSCPSNLGTSMRASVHVELPGWAKAGKEALEKRCQELKVQPRGIHGESSGQQGAVYDISNKHRLGYTEPQLVQTMIEGVNKLWKEDKELRKNQAK